MLASRQLADYRLQHYPLPDLTFFLLTKHRPRSASRQLELLEGFNAHVVILDGGWPPSPELLSYCSSRPHIEYFQGSLADRLSFVAHTQSSPFGMLVTDDDLFLGQGIDASLKKLKGDASLGTCVGAGATMMLSNRGRYGFTFQVGSYVDRRRNFTVDGDTPSARLQLQLLDLGAQTWYVPQRTETISKACQITADVLAQIRDLPQSHGKLLFPIDDVFSAIVAYVSKIAYVPFLTWLRWGPERCEEQPTWMTKDSNPPQGLQFNHDLDAKATKIIREVLCHNGIDKDSAALISYLPLLTRTIASKSGFVSKRSLKYHLTGFKSMMRKNQFCDEVYFRHLTSYRRVRRQAPNLGIKDADWHEISLLMKYLDSYRSNLTNSTHV